MKMTMETVVDLDPVGVLVDGECADVGHEPHELAYFGVAMLVQVGVQVMVHVTLVIVRGVGTNNNNRLLPLPLGSVSRVRSKAGMLSNSAVVVLAVDRARRCTNNSQCYNP